MLHRTPILLSLLLVLPHPALAETRESPANRQQIQLSFAPVVRKAAPAVVNVFTRKVIRGTAALGGLQADPLFRRFFGDDSPFGRPDRVQNSLGSGVLVRADGTIVTNHHVIKDSDEITVVLADRREFDATVLRSDERTDLAVLKINAPKESLPFLEIRDSDELEVGDLVLAIGNPFGVGQTVTNGIVSALARAISGINDYRFFIQTDAAINPGNSGGALVSMDGKLVGINTAIFSQSGGSVGIGFAIPTAMVRGVLGAAGSGGRVIRPWLGTNGQNVTSELAVKLALRHPVGMLVSDVVPNSPAAQSGIKAGDVIMAIDGREVEDMDSFRFRFSTLQVGEQARLGVWRAGRPLEVSVPLTAPPEQPARDVTALAAPNPLAGATVANLSPALGDELSIDAVRGVIILNVQRNSLASRLHVAVGDVVVSANDRLIETVGQLAQLVLRPGSSWRLVVKRDEQLLSVTVAG